jgi:hypothetical protein
MQSNAEIYSKHNDIAFGNLHTASGMGKGDQAFMYTHINK